MSLSMQSIAPNGRAAVVKLPIHVAVGAIVKDGCVLLAKRAAHQHQGGLWEFPGGKVEAGELIQTALIRELEEELAITATEFKPLIQICHQYSDKSVLLDVWRVLDFEGEPRGVEGQPLEWVSFEQLHNYEFPAANKPIVSALLLPNIIAITPEVGSVDKLEVFIERALMQGADSIHIRAPQLSAEETWHLYNFAKEKLPQPCGICWLNSGHVVNEFGELSLSSRRLNSVSAIHWKNTHRHFKAHYPTQWSSLACHDLSDVTAAEQLGFDCVTLSPVNPTLSHPSARSIGWEPFSQWVAQATIPVYALGGMKVGDLEVAQQVFAQGIAGIRLFEAN